MNGKDENIHSISETEAIARGLKIYYEIGETRELAEKQRRKDDEWFKRRRKLEEAENRERIRVRNRKLARFFFVTLPLSPIFILAKFGYWLVREIRRQNEPPKCR